jgi:hypothetical protein
LAKEAAQAQELRQSLENYLGTTLNIGLQDWYKLVNAYVYGGYPIEAIAQAIKWSGKTVHPTIAWSVWKNSQDYLNYINK